jgi:L-arabinokinase
MDQMASLLGQQNRLLALLCQPAEILKYVDIPSSLAVWGVDSGIRHAVSGADYGSVRVGAFMGYRLMEQQWRQDRRDERRAEAEHLAESGGGVLVAAEGAPVHGSLVSLALSEGSEGEGCERGGARRRLGDGYLSNVAPSAFEEHFASLPPRMAGTDFLAAFPEGHGDSVTSVSPDGDYAVLQPARHPVYEHFRVKSFAELLHGAPVAMGPFGRQVEMLGELMYQSHQVSPPPSPLIASHHLLRFSSHLISAHTPSKSYSACGLGSEGTDRIVDLVRRAGISRGLYGAKITGGGSGGTVAVMGHVGAGEAIADVAARYEREMGHKPHLFTGSSPGALAFGHYRLRPVA